LLPSFTCASPRIKQGVAFSLSPTLGLCLMQLRRAAKALRQAKTKAHSFRFFLFFFFGVGKRKIKLTIILIKGLLFYSYPYLIIDKVLKSLNTLSIFKFKLTMVVI